MDSTSDKRAYISFLLILAWVPLPLASHRLWSLSLLCILVFLLAAFQLFQGLRGHCQLSTPLRKSWPVILLFALGVGWTTVQSVPSLSLSISPVDTQHAALSGWCYLLMFCLALQLVNSSQRVRTTGYVLVGSALFQAVYGSLMALSGLEYTFLIPKDSYIGVSTGTFINRNSQAAYLVICLSVGVGLMIATLSDNPAGTWREVSRRWLQALLGKKIILRIALLIIVAGLVMTHSRMGNTAFFASLLVLGVVGLLLGRQRSRSYVLLLASLVVLDIFVVGTFFGVEQVAARLQTTSLEKEARDEVARNTVELMQVQLLPGTGAGSYYTAFPEYRTEDVGKGFYVNAHNDYLEFTTEFGLLGAVPLGLAVLASLIAALRALSSRKSKTLRGIAFGSAMSMLAMGIHATVDFNLQIPANSVTFMVVLALAWVALFMDNRRGGRMVR